MQNFHADQLKKNAMIDRRAVRMRGCGGLGLRMNCSASRDVFARSKKTARMALDNRSGDAAYVRRLTFLCRAMSCDCHLEDIERRQHAF
jgi:hypothetical protein